MDDYPNPEDEYEAMYEAEMEAMQDMMDNGPDNGDFDLGPSKRAKKSLNFPKVAPAAPETEDVGARLLDSSLTGVEEQQPQLEQIQHEINRTGSSRKRKAAVDLFGDIEDIEQEEIYTTNEPSAKELKQQQELKEDLELIERIREERRKILAAGNLLPNGNERQVGTTGAFGSEYISDRVPRYPFVTLRNLHSDKFYLRLKSDDQLSNEIRNVKAENLGLLPTSLDDTWQEAERLFEKMQRSRAILDRGEGDEDMEVVADQPKHSERLWVEKYQPRGYRDLLSDEGTNKMVLKWLKMWDYVVFDKKRPTWEGPKRPHDEKASQQQQPGHFEEEFDAHNRPKQKVALLCGPPGLGKTTLAHILARHAGYNPVEVNASDDSSTESFRLVLEAATQMRSVLGDDPRPNCLILDEIDGTPAATIEVLLKFISDKDVGKGTKKGKGSKPHILKRPVICICNDPYVAALRPLKQHALIVNFPPTTASRLSQRLMEVAKLEQIQVDTCALLMLCDKTGNDIRSCLSFLHFFKTSGKRVRMLDVQDAAVGQKDAQRGLFTVWHEIFQTIKKKNSTEKENSLRGRLFRIIRLVQNFGEFELLSHGVHENFLQIKTKDVGFKNIWYGLGWFCHFDLANALIRQQQNWALLPQLATSFGAWHALWAGPAWPKIHFPSRHTDARSRTQQMQATLAATLRGLEPGVRATADGRRLLLDTLPLFLHVAIPNLTGGNAQLLSTEERNDLQRVVSIYLQFNLSFVQERTANGDFVYRLEPNVTELVEFPDGPLAPQMSYALKQLVGHEVDSERLRRSYQATAAATAAKAAAVDTPSRRRTAPEVVPNHLQTLSPQILKKATTRTGLKSWLTVTRAEPTATQVAAEAEKDAADLEAGATLTEVSYAYKEGFSNAVRKPIKVLQLL